MNSNDMNRMRGSHLPERGLHESIVGPDSSGNEIQAGNLASLGIREIVIVDSLFDRYADFVAAASDGAVGLHFCNDGLSALKLARRFRGDIWLVSTELPDMSGFDLLPILLEHVQQGDVDPLLRGARISLETLGTGLRSGVFMVSDLYRIEEEQRALSCGSAGYLVRPITLDLVKALREPGRSVPVDPSSSQVSKFVDHRS